MSCFFFFCSLLRTNPFKHLLSRRPRSCPQEIAARVCINAKVQGRAYESSTHLGNSTKQDCVVISCPCWLVEPVSASPGFQRLLVTSYLGNLPGQMAVCSYQCSCRKGMEERFPNGLVLFLWQRKNRRPVRLRCQHIAMCSGISHFWLHFLAPLFKHHHFSNISTITKLITTIFWAQHPYIAKNFLLHHYLEYSPSLRAY